MNNLVWVTNFANPFSPTYRAVTAYGEPQHDAIERDRQIWNSFIKGRPRATDTYSVEELEAMGMHGLYKRDES